MKTNIKSYSDNQLLEKVESVGGIIPNRGKYLIIGVQSQEDAFNVFDDKFYVFDGPDFKQVSSGTTNAGRTALFFYDKYNLPGTAVWKTDMFYSDLFKRGYHKGKMRALRQQKPIYFYRDSDKDMFIEEQGELHNAIIYANMHGVDYNPYSNINKEFINGWSFACQVWNRMGDYRQMVNAVWKRNRSVDYALIKEF
ncbi:hypothetical protein PL373_14725 [Tenacibaculum maritimum]|nr:hypothetical protein [Tenacibaculum maritimum]MDB0602373.1 hypothetical protein [Tenacibaculum maritimum]MDB0613466.1 hypothetical protein [Tenacibaculum maritimum]